MYTRVGGPCGRKFGHSAAREIPDIFQAGVWKISDIFQAIVLISRQRNTAHLSTLPFFASWDYGVKRVLLQFCVASFALERKAKIVRPLVFVRISCAGACAKNNHFKQYNWNPTPSKNKVIESKKCVSKIWALLSLGLILFFLRLGHSQPQQEWHMIKVQFGTPYDKNLCVVTIAGKRGQLNSSLGLKG